MTDPSNIERFNELTARILADLYQAFPVPHKIHATDYGPEPSADCNGKPDADTLFFAATVRWLIESGYIRCADDGGFVFLRAVLTPKGLEALCVTPRSLQGEAPLGERLSEALKSGSKSLLAETIKAVLAAGASRWFGG